MLPSVGASSLAARVRVGGGALARSAAQSADALVRDPRVAADARERRRILRCAQRNGGARPRERRAFRACWRRPTSGPWSISPRISWRTWPATLRSARSVRHKQAGLRQAAAHGDRTESDLRVTDTLRSGWLGALQQRSRLCRTSMSRTATGSPRSSARETTFLSGLVSRARTGGVGGRSWTSAAESGRRCGRRSRPQHQSRETAAVRALSRPPSGGRDLPARSLRRRTDGARTSDGDQRARHARSVRSRN